MGKFEETWKLGMRARARIQNLSGWGISGQSLKNCLEKAYVDSRLGGSLDAAMLKCKNVDMMMKVVNFYHESARYSWDLVVTPGNRMK